jgi:hypothetical protein
MRNLLALAALALVTFALVGWYLGWYRLQTEPAAGGHREITIDINGPKIGQDLSKGKAKLNTMLENKGTPAAPQVPAGPSTQQQTPPAPPPGPPQPVQGTTSWERPGDSSTLTIPIPDSNVPPGPPLPPP